MYDPTNVLQKTKVASSGIEPESGASETLILSIVLRGRRAGKNNRKYHLNHNTMKVQSLLVLSSSFLNLEP